jgi:tRNA A58 N-methylase Trm61
VDFGAGSGHLGLAIAYLRPKCKVILVEPCEFHAEEQARQRISELGLENCTLFAAGAMLTPTQTRNRAAHSLLSWATVRCGDVCRGRGGLSVRCLSALLW